MRSKKPQVFADVAQNPHFAGDFHGSARIRGWICAPMIVGDRVLGVLSIDKFEPDFYTEELAVLATGFAAQAGIAIENARLLETERAAREQAETLRAAAELLGSALGASEIFDLILVEMRKVVPYTGASVQQRDGDEFVIVGGHGYPNIEALLGIRYTVEGPEDPAYEMVGRLEPIIVADVAERFANFQDPFGPGSIKSWMAVPLLVGDRLIGMLTFDSFEPDSYTRRACEHGEGVWRLRRDGDREGAVRHRAGAGAGGGGGGDAGEERVPGHDEPRDPDADERGDRHDRPAARTPS